MEKVYNWLLDGQPWINYRTRIDLLTQPEKDRESVHAKEQIREEPRLKNLLTELKVWPGYALKTHKDANHLTHKLAFIADLGFTIKDKDIEDIAGTILKHQSPEGPFQVISNIPTHFGGTGKDDFSWMLCDAPTIVYALLKFGLKDNNQVKKVVAYLVSLIRDNGWPCAASSALGKFRGPGRKDDPCPYANLLMLKVLSQLPEYSDSKESRTGVDILLNLWEQRKERKPYLFAMGTDFKKLKAPFIWYDILHVADVLTQFPWIKKDKRLLEMIEIIESKKDENEYYKAESIWRVWKDWDFGQKKEPSRWITFLVYRILKRMD